MADTDRNRRPRTVIKQNTQRGDRQDDLMRSQFHFTQPADHHPRDTEHAVLDTHLQTDHRPHPGQFFRAPPLDAAASESSAVTCVTAPVEKNPGEDQRHQDTGEQGRDTRPGRSQCEKSQFSVNQDIISEDIENIPPDHDIHRQPGIRDSVRELLESIEKHNEQQRNQLQRKIGTDQRQQLGGLSHTIHIQQQDTHQEHHQQPHRRIDRQAVFQQTADPRRIARPETLTDERSQTVRETETEQDRNIENAVHERNGRQIVHTVPSDHQAVHKTDHHDPELTDHNRQTEPQQLAVVGSVSAETVHMRKGPLSKKRPKITHFTVKRLLQIRNYIYFDNRMR